MTGFDTLVSDIRLQRAETEISQTISFWASLTEAERRPLASVCNELQDALTALKHTRHTIAMCSEEALHSAV